MVFENHVKFSSHLKHLAHFMPWDVGNHVTKQASKHEQIHQIALQVMSSFCGHIKSQLRCFHCFFD